MRRSRGLIPLAAWHVTDEDRWQHRHYGRVCNAVDDLLVRTDTPFAPWFPLPATDSRYANLAVFETLLRIFERRLGDLELLYEQESDEVVFDTGGSLFRRRKSELADLVAANGTRAVPTAPVVAEQAAPGMGILQRVDLSQSLDEKSYESELATLQARLYLLGLQIYTQKRPVMIIFEGWDAAGKGGAIKRITEKLDPRSYVVHSIAAPSGEERVRHYLYRFWRRLAPRGAIAIFDRSWYGRVLVERVEGFARPDEWRRAYAEINEFEQQQVAFGTILFKFWLHISPEEQLRRFERRRDTPYKAWKLTDEDWRNREKWSFYEAAADEMLLRTSTPVAPWTIVEAEEKRFARIKVLRTLVRGLEDQLGKVKI